MRQVALILVALLMAAALPATAQTSYDECPASPSVANPCVRFSTDQNAGGVTTPAGAAHTYYLWGAAATCAPTFGSVCSGRPEAFFVGILYEETNRLGGLQRFPTEIGLADYGPDAALLL